MSFTKKLLFTLVLEKDLFCDLFMKRENGFLIFVFSLKTLPSIHYTTICILVIFGGCMRAADFMLVESSVHAQRLNHLHSLNTEPG